jgi:hypothetical protein
MGYNLHITRKKNYYDEEGDWISQEEWVAYINSDPELNIVPENGPYFAQWNGKSEYPDPWFDWFDGCIETKSPDKPIIEKMISIAKYFNAKVQGDDLEIYISPTECYIEEK